MMIPRSAAWAEACSLQSSSRHPPQLLHERPVADELGRAVEVDVLVVLADLGLGGRSEDRLREAVGLTQARGQLDPADGTRLAVPRQPEPDR